MTMAFKFFFFLMTLSGVSCFAFKTKKLKLPFFYHSTDEISEELERLEESCSGLSIERKPLDGQHFIDVISISKTDKPISRLFLLAGEHARELISAESALHFVKGEADTSKP